MKYLIPIQLCIALLIISTAHAQISDSTKFQVENNKRFFESSIVGHTYVYMNSESDSTTVQLMFQEDSLTFNYNEISNSPTIYRYNVRYGRFNKFNIEIFQGNHVFMYLYCYLIEENDNRSFFIFPSQKKIHLV